VFCFDIHISGQNISPHSGYLPSNIIFKYDSY
jgi:hypothetical protein